MQEECPVMPLLRSLQGHVFVTGRNSTCPIRFPYSLPRPEIWLWPRCKLHRDPLLWSLGAAPHTVSFCVSPWLCVCSLHPSTLRIIHTQLLTSFWWRFLCKAFPKWPLCPCLGPGPLFCPAGPLVFSAWCSLFCTIYP